MRMSTRNKRPLLALFQEEDDYDVPEPEGEFNLNMKEMVISPKAPSPFVYYASSPGFQTIASNFIVQ